MANPFESSDDTNPFKSVDEYNPFVANTPARNTSPPPPSPQEAIFAAPPRDNDGFTGTLHLIIL